MSWVLHPVLFLGTGPRTSCFFPDIRFSVDAAGRSLGPFGVLVARSPGGTVCRPVCPVGQEYQDPGTEGLRAEGAEHLVSHRRSN